MKYPHKQTVYFGLNAQTALEKPDSCGKGGAVLVVFFKKHAHCVTKLSWILMFECVCVCSLTEKLNSTRLSGWRVDKRSAGCVSTDTLGEDVGSCTSPWTHLNHLNLNTLGRGDQTCLCIHLWILVCAKWPWFCWSFVLFIVLSSAANLSGILWF